MTPRACVWRLCGGTCPTEKVPNAQVEGWAVRALIRSSLVSMILIVAVSASARGDLYFNGFETNTHDWSAGVARVPSGTGGISSSSGSFHAQAGNGDFTRWGGYNFGAGNAVPTPFQPYSTSVDIYLNVNGGWANDTRFDFSSAINNNLGTHRRDFIFNGGFYNDATGPGANTNRFVISASNNSQPGSAFAKNPARDPIAIGTSGWYTFGHRFYDNNGVLAVEMTITDASSNLIHSWTLSDPSDLIGLIGGNRYGWFDYSQFPTLGIDNARLTLAQPTAVPEPASLVLWGLGMVGGLAAARLRRKAS